MAVSPSSAVRTLSAAVDALAAQAAADLPGPQALADAAVLVQALEQLRSVVRTRVADVDARDLHALADAPSTGTWLAARRAVPGRGMPARAG